MIFSKRPFTLFGVASERGIKNMPNSKSVREVEVRQAVEASRKIPGIQGAAIHCESNELFIEAIIRGKHRIVEPRRFIRLVSEMQKP